MLRHKYRILNVNVTDVAIVCAFIFGIIGIVWGLFFSIKALFFTDYLISNPEAFSYAKHTISIILLIIALTIISTIIFGIIGFLSGIILSLITNVGFRFSKGIRYVIEE